MLKYFKKFPVIGERLKYLKPNIEEILNDLFVSENNLTIIDVGANTGQSIDLFRKIFRNPLIYSFEPTPDIFQILEKKYKNNTNIFLYEMALGEENCYKEMITTAYSPTNSFFESNLDLYKKFNKGLFKILSKNKKTKVKVIRFDDFYEENLSDKIIDIFKIDTQGFEYNVIKGGLNTIREKTKLLYFEIQYLPFYKDITPFYKIFELLYNNNFYFYSWIPTSKKKYQILESDVIFLNKKYFDMT